MSLFRLLLLSSILVFSGCATVSKTDKQAAARTTFLNSLSACGVAPATYDRMSRARVLTFKDVLNLVKAHVPSSQIVAYMKATYAPYNYSAAQVRTLTKAGADSTLINFVGRSSGAFLIDAQNAVAQGRLVANAKFNKELWNDPYFMDEGFDGDMPFAFGWPGMMY